MKFKVIEGAYAADDGKLYTKGKTVKSNTRLDKVFPGELTCIDESLSPELEESKKKAEKKAEEAGASSTKGNKGADGKGVGDQDERGNDVSDQFDYSVKTTNIQVFAKDGLYNLYKGGSKTPSNKKPCPAAKVLKLIEKYGD